MLIDYDMESTLQRRHNRENTSGLAPVQLRITISGKRSDLSTGVFCPAAYWNTNTNRIVMPADKKKHVLPAFSAAAVKQLNDALCSFVDDVSEIYKRLRKPNPRGPVMAVTVAQVKAAVRPKAAAAVAAEAPVQHLLIDVSSAFLLTMQQVPAESRLTDSTLKTYVTRHRTLGRYLRTAHQEPLLAQDITTAWCRKFERWLMSEQGGFSAVSMRKQINYLQMALDFAVAEAWLPGPMLLHGYKFQTKLTQPPAFSLPASEVERLASFLPELEGPERKAVTGWLFCCYTGLSWADYRHFCRRPADYLYTELDSETKEPQCWLRMTRQKMKRRKPQGFSTPLFGPAADLLIAWRGRLPHSHGVNTNLLLHRVEAELQLSQSLTTKLARATFSQMRRDEGYSDEAVAAMMGDTVSVMNKHYSRVSERRIALEMKRIGKGVFMQIAA